MLAFGREIQEKCFDANLAKTQNDDVCLIELLADLVRVVLSLYNSFLWIFYFLLSFECPNYSGSPNCGDNA